MMSDATAANSVIRELANQTSPIGEESGLSGDGDRCHGESFGLLVGHLLK
jgi:hypothetical protein